MEALLDGRLVIGAAREAVQETEELAAHDVTRTIPLNYDEYRLADDGSHSQQEFAHAVDAVRQALDAGETVFLHCARGRNRTGAVASAVVAAERGWSVERALEYVGEQRPEVHPRDALLEQAEAYCETR